MQSLDILSEDDNIDAVVLEVSVPFMQHLTWVGASLLDELVGELARFKGRCKKSFIAVVVPAHAETEALAIRDSLVSHGIPSFPSFQRGANALIKAITYWERQGD